MRIAVEGCSHGELDAIYASVQRAEREANFKVDLLLLCGDFQALRNMSDLDCIAVPDKFKQIGGFQRYYSGEKIAPVLTLVIGGNHEASNYMWELFHGGWLAPNIYYLGAAGAVEVGGLTIAGASGIFKPNDYEKGRYERLPYDRGTIRSTYHTRRYDIERLKQLGWADIVMSHDWPNTIEQYGNTQALIKRKPFFADEIRTSTLGSPPLMELLQTLKPPYWFSAHLHVKFAALMKHDATPPASSSFQGPAASNPRSLTSKTQEQKYENPEALDIDLSDEEGGQASIDAGATAYDERIERSGRIAGRLGDKGSKTRETRFLALSKCLPNSDFLQFLEVPSPEDGELSKMSPVGPSQRLRPSLRFSKRWLAITKAYHPYLSLDMYPKVKPPRLDDADLLRSIEENEAWIENNLMTVQSSEGEDADHPAQPLQANPHPLDVCRVQNFTRTAPSVHEPGGLEKGPPPWYTNPQTESLCNFLNLPNKVNPSPLIQNRPPPQPTHQGRFGNDSFDPKLMKLGQIVPAQARGQASGPNPLLPPDGNGNGGKRKRSDSDLLLEGIGGDGDRDVRDPAQIDIDLDLDEDAEVEEGGGGNVGPDPSLPPLTLDDEEDGLNLRWGEGAG
ncbi:hypothetical protein IE53DRAFT_309976 [Violaceomyces palustris]|uniref:Uncharacterized protein n=1 Tax=Violaceomyces palustris TaxID=1673888 RepID=A0ACD0P681_9BASI|nr:hypothetical protein IE53DRAFT_309976 [Violaceomyces palustris]